MKSVIEIIQMRHSIRNYSNREIEPEKLKQIREYIDSNQKGLFGSKMRFQIVDGSAYNMEELRELGAYGLIKGPRVFIAGAVNGNPQAMEDFGYSMEKIILFATRIGLGTCWLGGFFNRSAFAEKLKITGDEVIPAVTPIGYAAEKETFIGQTVLFLVGARKRKEAAGLFFNGSLDTPLGLGEGGDLATVLEAVRWAPSAGNRQPWRIVKQGNTLHFYLKEDAAYNNEKRFPGVKMQNVDLGIAMAHFDLVAAELGMGGSWEIRDPQINPSDLKYIASWVGEIR